MTLESVEYICPAVLILITFILKLFIDEEFSFEHLKRLIVETAVDIMSLATSFVISFLIGCVAKNAENASKGIILLIVCFLFLIIVVVCSKFSIRKYSETEKKRYLLVGIAVGYTISLFFLCNSIILLRDFWGAQ